MSKKDAENNGCSIIQRQFNHEDRAIVDENDGGKLILYVDKDNYIRGGTMIAKNAGEIQT